MNRRHFLSSTTLSAALGGATLIGLSGSAKAFSTESCATAAGTPACREMVRHHELLAQINDMLNKKGVSDAERKDILAAAICPFCGQPLIG
jgi:hypothetical protein